jgi:hypothetical protein
MLYKFVSVCLLYISYYIILSNMICNNSNEVILRFDIENKNNSMETLTSHDIDIENGLYSDNLHTLYGSVYNSKKNNLMAIISKVSYVSYNFFKNIKTIVYNKVNYLYPSNKK